MTVAVDSAWYAVRSATRQEERAERGLVEQGMTVYLPREARWRRTPRKTIRVERPLFVGYLFVRCMADDFPRVNAIDGVHQFVRWVTCAGEVEPARFPDQMVLGIQADEWTGVFDHTQPTVSTYKPEVGDRVQITGSMWAGRFAKIVKLRPGERKAELELEGMGRAALAYGHLDAAVP